MQACRYCGTVRYGAMVILPNGKTDTTWSYSDPVGLENESSKDENPIHVDDIDAQSGEITGDK